MESKRNYSIELEGLKTKLNRSKTELALAKRSNEELKEIYTKHAYAEETLNEVKFMLSSFKDFSVLVNKEDAKFKQRRLDYLCNYIDNNLQRIFPYDDLKSKIYVNFKYKSQLAKLKLRNSKGREFIPKIAEGGLKRHLISFSSSLALVECLGGNKIYMDESFSTSSPENLTKIGVILQDLVEKNFQVVLVEHQSDIYKDLPRREIHLDRDKIQNKVIVTNIIDY